jgi:DNA modification methylase
MRRDAELYPDTIRVPSWRQLHGDKRANPKGRVPGDVFDFPRVVGNSKQRRRWHPTQLHKGLYERCVKLSCSPDDSVCDIFAGTGTLGRVCKHTGNPCTLVEMDPNYCEKIALEHDLQRIQVDRWVEWQAK